MSALRWPGSAGWWVSLGTLLCGTAATVGVVGPAYTHRTTSMPVAEFGDGLQRAFWLPWQLVDNVASGRALLDGSVFLTGQAGDLLDYAGNPGAAVFGALAHASLPDPAAAHDIWLLTMVATNAVAMASLGRALGEGRVQGALLGAAMGAGCAVWTCALGAGALAAGWIAPSAWLLRGWVAGRTSQVVVAGILGGLVAPVSVLAAAALVAGGVVSRSTPGSSTVRALVLATVSGGALAIRLNWPPLGAGLAAPDMALAQWAGPLAGALSGGRVGMPLLAGAGLVMLLHAGGRRSVVSVLAIVAAALLLGSWLLGSDGATAQLAPGFGLAGVASGARWWVNEGACALALVGLVSVLSGTRGTLGTVALAIWALAEPSLLVHRGQPAGLWPGAPWPVPASLQELAASPRTHVVVVLPLLETRDGAVGFVPFHRQRVVAPPGVHQDVATRQRFLGVTNEDAALRALASLGRDQLAGPAPPSVTALLARGIDRVVLVGGDPALRASATHAFGPGRGDVWSLDVARGAPGARSAAAPPAAIDPVLAFPDGARP